MSNNDDDMLGVEAKEHHWCKAEKGVDLIQSQDTVQPDEQH